MGNFGTVSQERIVKKPRTRRLSPRLQETFAFMLQGLSKKEIAEKMGLSAHTVHDYVRTIYREYGVRSQPKLMALFIPLIEVQSIAAGKK